MDYLDKLDKAQLAYLENIGQAAQDLNMRAFLVGGAVRDLILGHSCKDLDVAIEGDVTKVAQGFAHAMEGELVLHKSFGTATVTLKSGYTIDFAMTRVEKYKKPGAMPTVSSGDIYADLARRDITINAMAIIVSPQGFGELIDEFNGLEDLQSKTVKVLHEKTFDDDPTRLFRVVRYSERLGFTIDEWTLNLMTKAVEGECLTTVSTSRIQRELEYIGEENKKEKMLNRLNEIMGEDPVFSTIYKGVK